MAESDGSPKYLRHLLIALTVGLVGLLAGGLLTATAVAALGAAGVTVGPSVYIVVSLVLTQGVGFGGVALAYLRYRGLAGGFVRAHVPTLRGWIWVGAGYVLALVAAVTVAVVAFLAGAPQTRNRVVDLAFQDPSILLLMIPASFVLVGPGEELLFRGIVQGRLRQAFGPVGAIGLASGVFAAVHVVAYTGGPTARLVGITVLFFPSLVLGVAYEHTDNIVVPSLIHGAYNATLFTLLFVSIRFGTVS